MKNLFWLPLLLSSCYTLNSGNSLRRVSECDSTLDKSVERLIKKMSCESNPNHIDFTDSVYDLIDVGLPAMPKLLQVMIDGNDVTRMAAQHALEGILPAEFGFQDGIGWATEDGQRQYSELFVTWGGPYWNDSLENRRVAVLRGSGGWWKHNRSNKSAMRTKMTAVAVR